MSNAPAIHAFVRDLFKDDARVDVQLSAPMVDVRAYPGRHEGKDWEVNIHIDARAPALPKPAYWSATAGDVYHPVSDTGDVPPAEVVAYAHQLVRALRGSGYQFAGMNDLERETLEALNSVVQSSNANDEGSLMNAIQDAQRIAHRFFEDPTDPDHIPDEEPEAAPAPGM